MLDRKRFRAEHLKSSPRRHLESSSDIKPQCTQEKACNLRSLIVDLWTHLNQARWLGPARKTNFFFSLPRGYLLEGKVEALEAWNETFTLKSSQKSMESEHVPNFLAGYRQGICMGGATLKPRSTWLHKARKVKFLSILLEYGFKSTVVFFQGSSEASVLKSG